jgi:hypothetical protein
MYWNDHAARSIEGLGGLWRVVLCLDSRLAEKLATNRMTMATRKQADPSPESLARAHRQRIAAEEGVRAIADVERQAAAVRKNMDRLRALRQAKEADDARELAENPPPPAKPKAAKRVKKAAL